MKYLNIILTVIAVILLSLSFHLIHLKALIVISNRNNQSEIKSNQELINSSHRLEQDFSNLVKEIEKLNDKLSLKKEEVNYAK